MKSKSSTIRQYIAKICNHVNHTPSMHCEAPHCMWGGVYLIEQFQYVELKVWA